MHAGDLRIPYRLPIVPAHLVRLPGHDTILVLEELLRIIAPVVSVIQTQEVANFMGSHKHEAVLSVIPGRRST